MTSMKCSKAFNQFTYLLRNSLSHALKSTKSTDKLQSENITLLKVAGSSYFFNRSLLQSTAILHIERIHKRRLKNMSDLEKRFAENGPL